METAVTDAEKNSKNDRKMIDGKQKNRRCQNKSEDGKHRIAVCIISHQPDRHLKRKSAEIIKEKQKNDLITILQTKDQRDHSERTDEIRHKMTERIGRKKFFLNRRQTIRTIRDLSHR